MTIMISTNGEHRHDQSSGVQSGGGLNKDGVALSDSDGMGGAGDVDLAELPDIFENFLNALAPVITMEQLDFADDVEAAWETPTGDADNYFIDVQTDDETINDIFFSQSDGTLFNGQVAKYDGSNITVVGSPDPIYIYSFEGGDVLILSTQEPISMDPVEGVNITDPTTLDGTMLVAAYYLEENGTNTGADVWGVTFQPIDHPDAGDDSGGEHDDVIDFADFLHVTVTGNLSFNFDTLESGKFLWVAVGDDDNGLLVTGKDLNVDDVTGDRESAGSTTSGTASDSINTSQGGAGATIGVNNQLWTPGNEGVFTFVKGFGLLGAGPDATGDNVNEIDYADINPYINTVGAGLFISQKQGSPASSLDMTITVVKAGGGISPEEGFGYIGAENGNDGTSGAFEDDTAVPVETVTVRDETGAIVAIWVLGVPTPATDEVVNGATVDDVTVNIGVVAGVDDHIIEIDGVDELYTIEWTVFGGTTFNRFFLSADAGKFDVGRVDVTEGLRETENIGADVIIHDDGPTANITDTGIMVVHDESANAQNDPLAVPIIGSVAGADNLSVDVQPTIVEEDTFAVNGEVVFTFGLVANGFDGVEVGDLIGAIAGLDSITDAFIDGTDLVVTRDGSSATLEFSGAIAQKLSIDGVVHTNEALDDDLVEDENDDDQDAGLLAALSSVSNQGVGVTGWARSAEPVVSSDGTDFGTDGPATTDSVIWSLAVGNGGANADSGFVDLFGNAILLNVEDVGGGVMVVVGRVDGGPNNDKAAIAIVIDQDGHLSVAQYLPIGNDETNPDELDDRESMLDGALLAVLTVKDGDGDFDTTMLAIGDAVKLEDDGPTQTVTGNGEKNVDVDFRLNLDETADDDLIAGQTDTDTYNLSLNEDATGDDNADGDEEDLSAVPNNPTLIPIGRLETEVGGGLATLFNSSGTFGTDGSGGALAYDFSFLMTNDPGDDGLETNITTINGRIVYLFLEDLDGDADGELEIVGREGDEFGDADDTGDVALRISLVNPTSSTNAQLLAEQFIAFDHGDDGNYYDSELTLEAAEVNGLVDLELKITRDDGDTDSAVGADVIALIDEGGSPFAFDDDGPQVTVTPDVDGGEIAALLRNLDETINADGDHAVDDADTTSINDTPDNNGDLDDVIDGVSNEPVFQINPASADAIGRLSTTAGQLAALFGDEQADFDAFVDFGTDGPGDTLDTDGRTDVLSFVDFGTPIKTNLTATAVDGSAIENATSTEREIYLVWVSATVIEGVTIGAGGAETDDAEEIVVLRITLNNPTTPATATLTYEQFAPVEHGDTTKFDEELLLKTLSAQDEVEVRWTTVAEDGDLDQDSHFADVAIINNITTVLALDDDGPQVTVTTDVDGGEIAALLRNLDETVDADGDHTVDDADTTSVNDTPDNNGDLDDVIDGVSNEPVFQINPASADAIGRLSTTAGQLAALFGDEQADFDAFVDFGTDGPGDTLDTDGRTDVLSFVDFGDPIKTNLTATAVDGSAIENATSTEREIYLVWVSATVIEGVTIGAGGAETDDAEEIVVLRITLNNPTTPATATLTYEQFAPVEHGDTTKFDEELLLKTLSAQDEVEVRWTTVAEDGDLDQDSHFADVAIINNITTVLALDDDGPVITTSASETPTLTTDDTDLTPNDTAIGDFSGLFSTPDYGTDGMAAVNPLVYSLSVGLIGTSNDSGLVDAETNDAILLRTVGTNKIQGYLENDTSVVAFEITVDQLGNITLTQKRAIEHNDPDDPDETGDSAAKMIDNVQVQLTAKITDADGDMASATKQIALAFSFLDDGPGIGVGPGGGGDGAIDNIIVPYVMGESGSADLEIGEATDLPSVIQITDYSGDGDGSNGDPVEVNGVTLEDAINAQGTKVFYWEETNGVDGFQSGAGGDRLYYTYELKDLEDENGLPGMDGVLDTAVFTVHDIPPATMPDFDLNDLPSGQNGFGILASRPNEGEQLDPDGPALIIVGREPDYDMTDPMAPFTNKSDTINTSKGGGPTTIGNSNQMIDPVSNKDDNGEGIFFVYVNDPVDDFVSNIPGGLTQTEADQFANIQYNENSVEVVETDGAFFSVVQVQGNPKVAEAQIIAFDRDDATDQHLMGAALIEYLQDQGEPASRDLLSLVTIDTVIIERADGTIDTYQSSDPIETDVDFITAADVLADPDLTDADLGSAFVSGIGAGDTIRFETVSDHDMALINGISGKFDIGDYGLDLFNPTPDQVLEFTNQITDSDGDTDTVTHFVGIDGDDPDMTVIIA